MSKTYGHSQLLITFKPNKKPPLYTIKTLQEALRTLWHQSNIAEFYLELVPEDSILQHANTELLDYKGETEDASD
jgi:hypothetical protein